MYCTSHLKYSSQTAQDCSIPAILMLSRGAYQWSVRDRSIPANSPIGEEIPMTHEVVKALRDALEKDDVMTIIHQNEETVYEP